MRITEATPTDIAQVLRVERDAFGDDETVELVTELIDDPTAKPLLSLVAWQGDRAVGHIMFTAASLEGAPGLSVSILAPLAVIHAWQGQGVGGGLIEEGVSRLARDGVELVFVLGHPGYYPRHGFSSAIPQGLLAPYPISPEEAWMVRALRPGILGEVTGVVACARALDRPELWRE